MNPIPTSLPQSEECHGDERPLRHALQELNQGIQTFTGTFVKNHEDKMNQLEERIDKKLEISRKRPESSLNEGYASPAQSKAFEAYLRHGEHHIHSKSLTSGDIPGSYLLPPPSQERLQSTGSLYPAFRDIARQITVSSGSIEVILDRDFPETGWVTETQDRSLTKEGSLAKITLQVHELYAKQQATQRLLEDGAVNIEEWLINRIADKMTRIENLAFISGTGQNQPQGILSYPTIVGKGEWGKIQEISTGKEGAFPESSPADILIELVESLPTQYLKEAHWILSRSAHAEIRKLKSEHSGAYLWHPSLGDKPYGTLLGFPLLVMDEMPALVAGTASRSIAFGNFQEGYQVVDRGSLNVLRDPYSSKPYVEFYVTRRVGGGVINFDCIKTLSFSKK